MWLTVAMVDSSDGLGLFFVRKMRNQNTDESMHVFYFIFERALGVKEKWNHLCAGEIIKYYLWFGEL